ncbi:maltokinase N-terminal cap-like domain-containing protein [Streptomyces resistomycificus]|uniref:1,4-alpha-glucan branching protein n=1 Tax=Streptomyces resistomycificus TaxID=67356 RepID=A0A0L8LAU9_9ACTN|nr:hypothetical protein [Streptomyces resistomycificus]KOG35234.1 1,4-alpha-glucan branching protein [Streptomyces resistomycificus]KUN99904.1 1,4-alpha-glucan branching protein [Streptomyces resistomycificus]
MAVIHRTTLKPTKLELLTAWLPTRPWYTGDPDGPRLAKAGGFRLDDPRGEVGIEFMVATDTSGPHPSAYLVPLTYRGAPLEGAEHALVGTMEHGVLGPRWAYDGCQDPVLADRLLALIGGSAQAQAQSETDTPDRDVVRSCAGDIPSPSAHPTATATATATATDDEEGTELSLGQGATLRLCRVLRPAPNGTPVPPPGAVGHVAGPWQLPDGTRAQGLFAVLYPGARA